MLVQAVGVNGCVSKQCFGVSLLFFVFKWPDVVEKCLRWVGEVCGDAGVVVDAVAVLVTVDEGVFHGEFEVFVEAAYALVISKTAYKEFDFLVRDVA